MDSINENPAELIDPLEIKQEYDDGEDVKIVGLEEFVHELELLKDIFIQAENKLTYIARYCGFYFEASNICDIKLLVDRLQSAKTCLDQIDENFLAKTNVVDDEDVAISQLLLNHESSLSLSSEEEREVETSVFEKRSLIPKVESTPDSSEQYDLSDHNNTSSDSEYEPPENLEHEEFNNNLRGGRSRCKDSNTSSQQQKPRRIPKQSQTKNNPRGKNTRPVSVSADSTEEPKPKKKRNRKSTPKPAFVECSFCNKQYAYSGLTSHIKRCHQPREFKFNCTQCPRQFSTKSQLTAHAKTHSGVKPFVCEICGVAFLVHSYMVQHKRRHSEDRPLNCPHCDATFKYPKSLNSHIQGKHSEEKKNLCSKCGKLFSLVAKLKRHEENVHQSVRKFSCHLCSKVFKRGEHLKDHVKTHSNPNTKYRGLNSETKD